MLARGWSWTIILYRAEAVANSRACDLRKPSVSELIDTYAWVGRGEGDQLTAAAVDRRSDTAELERLWGEWRGREVEYFVENAAPDSPVMQQEIFGPILPMLTYRSIDDALG